MAKKGLSSEDARLIRQAGHDDALLFALCMGLDQDYRRDPTAKKDVIDPAGDAHSVKSGKKKWQVFLYGRNRFANDIFFQVMNGIGDILVSCIDSFPESFNDYVKDKEKYKNQLQPHMIELKEKLQVKRRLKAFISKSIFNGGEVDYLTVLDDGIFHVFWGDEISTLLSKNLSVENSIARNNTQFNNQKVILKYRGLNLGEIEMRNDSETHYREIRFNILKPRFMNMVFSLIEERKIFNEYIIVHGQAINRFGRW